MTTTLEQDTAKAIANLLDRINTELQWIAAHSLTSTDTTSCLRSYRTIVGYIVDFVWATVAELRSSRPQHCNARLAQLIVQLMNMKLSTPIPCSFLRKDICRYLDKSNPEEMIKFRQIRSLLSGDLVQLVFDPNDQSQYGGFKFVIRDHSTKQLYINSTIAPIWLERYNEYKQSIHTLNGVSGWKDIGLTIDSGHQDGMFPTTYIRLCDFFPSCLRKLELDAADVIALSVSFVLPEYLMIFPANGLLEKEDGRSDADDVMEIRFRLATSSTSSSSTSTSPNIRFYTMAGDDDQVSESENAVTSDCDSKDCINPRALDVAADCNSVTDCITAASESTVNTGGAGGAEGPEEPEGLTLEPLFALLDESSASLPDFAIL